MYTVTQLIIINFFFFWEKNGINPFKFINLDSAIFEWRK